MAAGSDRDPQVETTDNRPLPGLLGRARELAWLRERFRSSQRNGAGIVVVGGEPGIGKTTLTGRFAATCEADGARTVLVRCSPYDSDGIQPLRKLLSALGAAPPAEPGPADRGPAGPSDAESVRGERSRLFAEMTAAVLDAVGAEPTVLVLDDVHWGRPPLHELLSFLVEELRGRRLDHRLLLVLVTRVLPPPHSIAQLLADLERHAGVERLDLEGLADADVERLVAAEVTGPSSAYVDLVRRSARGNPLRVGAALQVLSKRGVAPDVRPADARTWGELRLPAELSDPLTAWVAELTGPARAVLAAGAVWGEEMTVGDVHGLVVPPDGDDDGAEGAVTTPDGIARHLAAATGIGLLETDGRRYWFAHAAFREVVLQLADVAGLAEINARCARRILDAGPGAAADATALRLGRHLLASGGAVAPADAVPALAAAGRAALRAFSWTEAARYLEVARSLDPEAPPDAELLLSLGQAYYFDHDFSSAEAVLNETIEVASATAPDHPETERIWGHALLTWLRILMVTDVASLSRVPPSTAARRYLAVGTDPTLRSLILQVLAEHHITAGDAVEGANLADEALVEADRSGDHVARAFALFAQGLAAQVAMRLGPGLDGVEEARREAMAADDWWVQSIMQTRLPFALLAAGHVARADSEAEAAVAEAGRRQEHSNQALGYCARTAAALLRGDFELVDELGERSRYEAERSRYVLADVFTGPTVVLGHLYRGDGEAAIRVAESWPNLPRSGRAALAAAADLLGDPDSAPDVRPPRAVNQVSAGFFAATLEVAARRGGHPGLGEAADLLERWTADGFELPPTYPSSLTRVRAEIALARGEPAAARSLFAEVVRWATANEAQVELARALAGTARLVARHGPAPGEAASAGEEAAARAEAIASLIGLDRRVLGLEGTTWDGSDGLALTEAAGAEIVVLITDIVGSTVVSRELGDLAYYRLVTAHHELVRDCLRRWSGHEFSESGDGLLAWFSSEASAVQAAFEVQSRAAAARRHGGFRVRVSLARGPALMRAGRPYGLLPALAARIIERAGPDEIVADGELCRVLPPGVGVAATEVVELKNVGRRTIAALSRA